MQNPLGSTAIRLDARADAVANGLNVLIQIAAVKGSTATPEQIEFIELVVQELTLNGVMDADRLFQSPFTDISSQGPLGVFPPASVSVLVEVLGEIRQRAVG